MADTDSSLTPEQRLLKLIEEQGGKEGSDKPGEATATKTRKERAPIDWRALLTPGAIKARLAFFRERVTQGVKSHQTKLELKQVNKLLKAATVCLAVYLVFGILYEIRHVNRDYVEELSLPSSRLSEVPIAPPASFESSIFDELTGRNIFIPIGKRAETAEQTSGVTLKLLEMTQNLKLTGISVNPDEPSRTFCMIEDISKSITTFLKEGDSFSGLRVAEIKPESVVLQYQDEKIEIR